MTTRATCTVLLVTDGQRATYGVAVGALVEPRDRPSYFDAHRARTVATYTITGRPDYVAMTEAHATPDAPAVLWQSRP